MELALLAKRAGQSDKGFGGMFGGKSCAHVSSVRTAGDSNTCRGRLGIARALLTGELATDANSHPIIPRPLGYSMPAGQ